MKSVTIRKWFTRLLGTLITAGSVAGCGMGDVDFISKRSGKSKSDTNGADLNLIAVMEKDLPDARRALARFTLPDGSRCTGVIVGSEWVLTTGACLGALVSDQPQNPVSPDGIHRMRVGRLPLPSESGIRMEISTASGWEKRSMIEYGIENYAINDTSGTPATSLPYNAIPPFITRVPACGGCEFLGIYKDIILTDTFTMHRFARTAFLPVGSTREQEDNVLRTLYEVGYAKVFVRFSGGLPSDAVVAEISSTSSFTKEETLAVATADESSDSKLIKSINVTPNVDLPYSSAYQGAPILGMNAGRLTVRGLMVNKNIWTPSTPTLGFQLFNQTLKNIASMTLVPNVTQVIIANQVSTVTDRARAKLRTLADVSSGLGLIADVDGNGHPDLVFQRNDNQFFVTLADAKDTKFETVLGPKHDGAVQPGQTMMADVDGDGKDDLIYQTTDNRFLVSASDGKTFRIPVQVMKHGGAYRLNRGAWVDVDGDKKADLIYRGDDNAFWLTRSQGIGPMTGALKILQHGGTFHEDQDMYADINGDGKTDILFQGIDNSFWLSLSKGTTFASPYKVLQHGGGFAPNAAKLGDVDGDGDLDLIYQGTGNDLYLSRWNGSVFSAPSLVMDLPGTRAKSAFGLVDVNHDGAADLIGKVDTVGIVVAISNRAGQFAAPKVHTDSTYLRVDSLRVNNFKKTRNQGSPISSMRTKLTLGNEHCTVDLGLSPFLSMVVCVNKIDTKATAVSTALVLRSQIALDSGESFPENFANMTGSWLKTVSSLKSETYVISQVRHLAEASKAPNTFEATIDGNRITFADSLIGAATLSADGQQLAFDDGSVWNKLKPDSFSGEAPLLTSVTGLSNISASVEWSFISSGRLMRIPSVLVQWDAIADDGFEASDVHMVISEGSIAENCANGPDATHFKTMTTDTVNPTRMVIYNSYISGNFQLDAGRTYNLRLCRELAGVLIPSPMIQVTAPYFEVSETATVIYYSGSALINVGDSGLSEVLRKLYVTLGSSSTAPAPGCEDEGTMVLPIYSSSNYRLHDIAIEGAFTGQQVRICAAFNDGTVTSGIVTTLHVSNN